MNFMLYLSNAAQEVDGTYAIDAAGVLTVKHDDGVTDVWGPHAWYRVSHETPEPPSPRSASSIVV